MLTPRHLFVGDHDRSFRACVKHFVDSGGTQRSLQIVIEGDAGSGKTWAMRKLAFCLAQAHLERVRSQQQRTTVADTDMEEDDESESKLADTGNNLPSQSDQSEAVFAAGKMIPFLMVGVRMESIWRSACSVEKPLAKSDGQKMDDSDEEGGSPPSSPSAKATEMRRRRQVAAYTDQRNSGGTKPYLKAEQYLESLIRSEFQSDPLFESFLVQSFRSRRLIFLIDGLEACSPEFQKATMSMFVHDLSNRGHAWVISRRAKDSQVDPDFVHPGQIVLRMRELSLVQQSCGIRCALQYDQNRRRSVELPEPVQRALHGLTILSQIRRANDEAFFQHYCRREKVFVLDGQLAFGDHALKHDPLFVEDEIESFGPLSAQLSSAGAGVGAGSRAAYLGDCLRLQQEADPLLVSKQLTIIDWVVHAFGLKVDLLSQRSKQEPRNGSHKYRLPSRPTPQLSAQIRKQAIIDQSKSDVVQVVLNLGMNNGNPGLCFTEDAAGRFVTTTPLSRSAVEKILGPGAQFPLPRRKSTAKIALGENGLELFEINHQPVVRTVNGTQLFCDALKQEKTVLRDLDELLLSVGLQRSVIWSSEDGTSIHYMLQRASSQQMQQWRARTPDPRLGKQSNVSSSGTVVLGFRGRRIGVTNLVPCTDDSLLTFAAGTAQGMRKSGLFVVPSDSVDDEITSNNACQVPNVDIVCSSQTELVATYERLLSQFRQLDHLLGKRMLDESAVRARTKKIVTIKTQTGKTTVAGDPQRRSHPQNEQVARTSTPHLSKHVREFTVDNAVRCGFSAAVVATKSFFDSNALDAVAYRRVEIVLVASRPQLAQTSLPSESDAHTDVIAPFVAKITLHLRAIYDLMTATAPHALQIIENQFLSASDNVPITKPKRTSKKSRVTEQPSTEHDATDNVKTYQIARRAAVAVRDVLRETFEIFCAASKSQETQSATFEPKDLRFATTLSPRRTPFMDDMASLACKFLHPLSLNLAVTAVVPFAASASHDAASIPWSSDSGSSFFGIRLDSFGLYEAAVRARFETECAGDVDPGDAETISQLVMASLFASGSWSFDSKFVKRAVKGKVSQVDASLLQSDPATMLRKNRPVKYRTLVDRRRYCRGPVLGDYRSDGSCVVRGDIISIVPQSQESEFAAHEDEYGSDIRKNWICTKPKHWLYLWPLDEELEAGSNSAGASKKSKSTKAKQQITVSDDVQRVFQTITPPRDTLLQVWESQISGARSSKLPDHLGPTLLHPFPFVYEVRGGDDLSQSMLVPAHLTFVEFASASYIRRQLGEFSPSEVFATRPNSQKTGNSRVGTAGSVDAVNSSVAQVLSTANASRSEVLSLNLKFFSDVIAMLTPTDQALRCSMHQNAHSEQSSTGEAVPIQFRVHMNHAFLADGGITTKRVQDLVIHSNDSLRRQMFGQSIDFQGQACDYDTICGLLDGATTVPPPMLLVPRESPARLTKLNLSGCNIVGSLRHLNIANTFPLLEDLRLAHNFFSGNIPVSLCSLRNLRRLHLHFNCLHGEIPLPLIRLYQRLGWEQREDSSGALRRRFRLSHNKGFSLPENVGQFVPTCHCGEPYLACITLPWIYKKLDYTPTCRFCSRAIEFESKGKFDTSQIMEPRFFHCATGAAPNSSLPHHNDVCVDCVALNGDLPSSLVLFHSSSQQALDQANKPLLKLHEHGSASNGRPHGGRQLRSRLDQESILDLNGVGLCGTLLSEESAHRRDGLLAMLIRNGEATGALSFDLGGNPQLGDGVRTIGGQLIVGDPCLFRMPNDKAQPNRTDGVSVRKSTLPRSYRCLSAVQVARLSNQGLVGTIPSTIQLVSQLQVLELANNQLTGHVVSRIYELPCCMRC